jgi:hypothetical protein
MTSTAKNLIFYPHFFTDFLPIFYPYFLIKKRTKSLKLFNALDKRKRLNVYYV